MRDDKCPICRVFHRVGELFRLPEQELWEAFVHAHTEAIERGEEIEELYTIIKVHHRKYMRLVEEIERLKGKIEHLQYVHGPARKASPEIGVEATPEKGKVAPETSQVRRTGVK